MELDKIGLHYKQETEMNLVANFKNDLKREFKGYNKSRFTKDVMSGITVAAVALPLALAFGVSSGATAAAGLVTAVIGGLIMSFFSGASFQISGPTGAMTAVLVTLAAKYGMQGILIASFIAGIFLVIAGFCKLGRVIYLIPSSVMTGFTSGIAVIIALGQLDNFFGIKSQGSLAITKFISYFTMGFHPNIQAMAVGIGVIILMVIWPKKLNEKIPSSLASIVLVAILVQFVDLNVDVIGDIPRTLLLEDHLSFASLNLGVMKGMLAPSFTIAALCMVESLLCGASAGKMKDEEMDADRELIAQGIGNMVIPIFGGVPATAAIARTSVAIKSGCETRLTGIIHSLILLLSMFVLAPVMSDIPLSALAGVLIVTAWRMNDFANIKYIFGHKFKSGMIKFIVTLAATVCLDLTEAIIIGVIISALLVFFNISNIDISVRSVDDKRLEEVGIEVPYSSEDIKVAYLTGIIFFAVVDKLQKELRRQEKNTKVLILSMRGVPSIDLSGVQAITELIAFMQEHGTKVYITSAQPAVLEKMRRGGVIDMIGEENVYESAEYAIEEAYEEL